MNKLYRIKPLEWIQPPGHTKWIARNGMYSIIQMRSVRYPVFYNDTIFGGHDSLEAAKAACESHRLKMLEAELEPVYQPEELPSTKATRMFVNKYIEKHQRTPIRLKCCCCFHQWDAEAIEPCGECTNNNVIKVDKSPSVAYPTATELPTEPGMYWFKDRLSSRWTAHKIEERLGTMAAIIGGDAIFVDQMQGQWTRIPEPEN